ncbi:carboxypeptidase-like regulatory domain-containing protein [Cytophagaceae bacterium ABcell3]|nr:carboxypeptidase-like regulatory domain-containing protein [Cytophagaceae bacterium ABcell3]
MSSKLFIILFFLLSGTLLSYGQNAVFEGAVTDEDGKALELVNVFVEETGASAITDEQGSFSFSVPVGKTYTFTFFYTGYKFKSYTLDALEEKVYKMDIALEEDIYELDHVEIEGQRQRYKDERRQASTFKLDPKVPKYVPSAFNDFNRVLATLPGVMSNNELSSQYAVRGGSFDENLVYVNEIEIYRPFLVRAGQQEGLSFVNPDLVEDVSFSAGGWQPRYGDKLSSVLAIKYKDPTRFKGSVSAGLLGGTAHLENSSKNRRVSWVIGARQKSSQYLLNSLPVEGEYFPRFHDVQSFITFDLTKRKDSLDFEKRTTISLLGSYARNRYNVIPATRETRFGTFFEPMNLQVAFGGQEVLDYDTWQGGIKFSHRTKDQKFRTNLIVSGFLSQEREFFDVEYAYRFCDIVRDGDFNNCAFTRGIGGGMDHARNRLTAQALNITSQNEIVLNKKNSIEVGFTQTFEDINDRLMEYGWVDSAGYVEMAYYMNNEINLTSQRTQVFAQHTIKPDTNQLLTYGVRLNYWSFNNQLLVSPRIQYSIAPKSKKDLILKFAGGVYQQPPFYRELRNREGQINHDIRAQTSYHAIVGSDLLFTAWGRTFKFISEAYFKYMTNVIPYDMDNVRLRYFGDNVATAYAAGADFRVSGEFIRGAESWISLGLLTTRENVEGDGRGYIRRPTDQRVTFSMFFQDHIPNNPSMKMYLKTVFGSGLPFGPPNSVEYRAAFNMPFYHRVDIGFSKLISFVDRSVDRSTFFESLWISLEVLNLTGANNTISYLWVNDLESNSYAIPNTLSQRFFNLRVMARF